MEHREDEKTFILFLMLFAFPNSKFLHALRLRRRFSVSPHALDTTDHGQQTTDWVLCNLGLRAQLLIVLPPANCVKILVGFFNVEVRAKISGCDNKLRNLMEEPVQV